MRTTWHNPTDQTLRFTLGTSNGTRTIILKPGETIELDSGYDPNIRGISPHLKRGPAPKPFTPVPFENANPKS
ncbi:MAG TPA: hypothetical protein VFB62_26715 [Polyangiaceae bacterium]|nr:hypothetical protein [Polyangiaceae bacterium]